MATVTKNAKTGTAQADKLKAQADALMIKKQLLAVRNGDLRSRVDLVVQTLKDNADTLTRKTGLSMPKEDAWVATVKVEDARHGIQATLEKCRAPQVKPADLKAPAKPYLKNTGIDLLKEMVSRLKEQNQQLTRESTLINAHLKHGCLLLNQHLEVFSLEDEWDGLVTVPHEQAMATLSEIQSLLDRMADDRMIKRQSVTIPGEKQKQDKAAKSAKTKAVKTGAKKATTAKESGELRTLKSENGALRKTNETLSRLLNEAVSELQNLIEGVDPEYDEMIAGDARKLIRKIQKAGIG